MLYPFWAVRDFSAMELPLFPSVMHQSSLALFLQLFGKKLTTKTKKHATSIGVILAVLAGIGLVISIITSIALDIELLGFLF